MTNTKADFERCTSGLTLLFGRGACGRWGWHSVTKGRSLWIGYTRADVVVRMAGGRGYCWSVGQGPVTP